jgi:hypothetical protein
LSVFTWKIDGCEGNFQLIFAREREIPKIQWSWKEIFCYYIKCVEIQSINPLFINFLQQDKKCCFSYLSSMFKPLATCT